MYNISNQTPAKSYVQQFKTVFKLGVKGEKRISTKGLPVGPKRIPFMFKLVK